MVGLGLIHAVAVATAFGEVPVSQEQAPPIAVALQWRAPPECPNEQAFVLALSELVGHRLKIDAEAPVEVRVAIEARETEFVMAIEFAGESPPSESKSLVAYPCEALVGAGSLVVATRLLAREPPEAEPEVERSFIPSPEPAVPVAPAQGEPPPSAANVSPPDRAPATRAPQRELRIVTPGRRPQVGLAVLTGLVIGAGPRPAPSLRAGLELSWSRFGVELWALHAFATEGTAADVRFEVGMTGGGAVGCAIPRRNRWSFPICAGGELGVVRARGIEDTAYQQRLRVGVPVTAGVAWRLTWWFGVRAHAGASATVTQPAFHVNTPDGAQTAFRTPWVLGYASLGAFGQW